MEPSGANLEYALSLFRKKRNTLNKAWEVARGSLPSCLAYPVAVSAACRMAVGVSLPWVAKGFWRHYILTWTPESAPGSTNVFG